MPFEEARTFAKSLNLKSVKAWQHYSKNGGKPINIPWNPQREYRNKWINWADFLGNYET